MFDALAENFWQDYKHCFDGMISCGHFSDEQLKEKFKELRNTLIWNRCFSSFVPTEKDSLAFWNKEYDKYIAKVKKKAVIQKVKQGIKKILSKIKEN